MRVPPLLLCDIVQILKLERRLLIKEGIKAAQGVRCLCLGAQVPHTPKDMSEEREEASIPCCAAVQS